MLREVWTIAAVVIICFIMPLGLTLCNFYNMFSEKKFREKSSVIVTVVLGGIEYLALFSVSFEPSGDWNEQIYPFEHHYPLSSSYELSVLLPCFAGLISLILLHVINTRRLSPVLSAAMTASVLVLNIFSTVFALQISKNILPDGEFEPLCLMLYLYHLNIFILSVSGIKKQINEQLEYFSEIRSECKNVSALSRWLAEHIKTISQYSVFVFALLLLAAGIMEIIFILTGQGADAQIKAFTDTADWMFSKQIPPPPKEYSGHYLCTVAAGGHKKVVKPLRYGSRRGAVIIVNRQLCIANAFEDLIAEKNPRFHRAVRGFYDRYGYPVSKLITTPLRADIVYIVMKPLEWLFLAFLYLFDQKPEIRIARQYRITQD